MQLQVQVVAGVLDEVLEAVGAAVEMVDATMLEAGNVVTAAALLTAMLSTPGCDAYRLLEAADVDVAALNQSLTGTRNGSAQPSSAMPSTA